VLAGTVSYPKALKLDMAVTMVKTDRRIIVDELLRNQKRRY